MHDFATLFQQLDDTTKTNVKQRALVDYFSRSSNTDIAWAIYFLLGNKLRPTISTKVLRQAAIGATNIPAWLFEETYQWVGDLAETISNIVPEGQGLSSGSLQDWVEQRLLPLAKNTELIQITVLQQLWLELNAQQRFVFNKLITGNFRVGVSEKLLVRALSDWSGIEKEVLAHRLMGPWIASSESLEALIDREKKHESISRPFPFCLAHSLPNNFQAELKASDFSAEWKWDGIRAQLIRRRGETFIWSRGEELLAGRFPEIEQAAQYLDDGTVLDGEILAWQDDRAMPFAQLQRRIQRKKVGAKLLQEVPVRFIAFDLLELSGQDYRAQQWSFRREKLQDAVDSFQSFSKDESRNVIQVATTLPATTWEELIAYRERAREIGAEGLMLKKCVGRYETGRVTGTWWKWKIQPLVVDAVLVYAQRGHGRRAALYTDYTFALWKDGKLVPFAKAYSGLSDDEIKKVDRWIRENIKNRFGPVHEVEPMLVMEIAFENVQKSTRHKSGVAVRFPRIVRWRQDKKPEEADQLESVLQMLNTR